MRLKIITSEVFRKEAFKHQYSNFCQTTYFKELKIRNGWTSYYLGLYDKEDLKGVLLLLERKTSLGSIFYSPRGYLIDYDDKEVLDNMTKEVFQFAKERNGIFVKIDPYLELVSRDIDGIEVVGINNKEVVNRLIDLGYVKCNNALQPNFMFVLDLEDKTIDNILSDMDSKTRNIIHKVCNLKFEVLECEKKDIERYQKIVDDTSLRRGFSERPWYYAEDMYNTFGSKIKILVASLDMNNYLDNLNKEFHKTKNDILSLESKEKTIKNSNKLKVSYEHIEHIDAKIKEAKDLIDKYSDKIDMASAMFITYGREIIYLYSGSYYEFKSFNPQYFLQWYMLNYAIDNKYKKYNFYGINNPLIKDDMYGVYQFKRGFNGRVVELIGEYDLVINKFKYNLYKLGVKLWSKMN